MALARICAGGAQQCAFLPPTALANCRRSAASPKFTGSGHSQLLQTKSRRVPSFPLGSQACLIRRKSWLLGTDRTYSYTSFVNPWKDPSRLHRERRGSLLPPIAAGEPREASFPE